MPVIGLLDPRSPHLLATLSLGFRQGLKETGYAAGENVLLEYRWAENQMDRLPAMAAELVDRQVSVIAASTPVAAFAAKAATTSIPIVFVVNEDPVRLGIVASLARPGGNATGINIFHAEVTAKRLSTPALAGKSRPRSQVSRVSGLMLSSSAPTPISTAGEFSLLCSPRAIPSPRSILSATTPKPAG
jgi:hypothetical protein